MSFTFEEPLQTQTGPKFKRKKSRVIKGEGWRWIRFPGYMIYVLIDGKAYPVYLQANIRYYDDFVKYIKEYISKELFTGKMSMNPIDPNPTDYKYVSFGKYQRNEYRFPNIKIRPAPHNRIVQLSQVKTQPKKEPKPQSRMTFSFDQVRKPQPQPRMIFSFDQVKKPDVKAEGTVLQLLRLNRNYKFGIRKL